MLGFYGKRSPQKNHEIRFVIERKVHVAIFRLFCLTLRVTFFSHFADSSPLKCSPCHTLMVDLTLDRFCYFLTISNVFREKTYRMCVKKTHKTINGTQKIGWPSHMGRPLPLSHIVGICRTLPNSLSSIAYVTHDHKLYMYTARD